MNDSELIAACVKNNRLAQKMLYDRYKKAMYTLAYRLTGDFDDANDVLQDAFIDVFRTLEKFRNEATIGAWIKAIVVRKSYQKLKKPKLFQLLDELPDDYDYPVQLESDIDGEALEKAILSLPEGFRVVFLMIEVEGFLHKEVAEILKISEGTSKSQLFYAKKKLREILGQFK